jgi:hypothetical protein
MKRFAASWAGMILLVLMSFSALAQTSDEDMLRRRAAEKCAQFNNYVSLIGRKIDNKGRAVPLATRLYYRETALKLFIANGNEYKEYVGDEEREIAGVMMQTTSVNRPNQKPKNTLMKTYLTNLANLRYSDVVITSTDVSNIKVSSLRKVDEDTYVCTCHFNQTFIGYRDGIPVYKDRTSKYVKCYVYLESTEDGLEYIIRLGDVYATDTERL